MSRPSYQADSISLDLLRAALWDGDAAARAWSRVVAAADIESLDPGQARLLPLAQRNVSRLGLTNPWVSRISGVHRYWWAHNQLLLRLCAQALETLERAGINTVVLKGVPLSLVYYEDPALRPMSDFDILVPRAMAPRALVVLSKIGWLPERRVDDAYTRYRHGVSLHNGAGRTLDLHWAIHEEDVAERADDEAWRTAVAVKVNGVPTRMLAPAPLLIHSLATGSKWAADPGVRWLADATLIVRRGDVDWDAVVREAHWRRFVVRTRSCLTYLRSALHVPVPQRVLAELSRQPVSYFERLEHRLRTRNHAVVGELPRYWLAWARTGPTAWRDPLGFARYLQSSWDLPSPAAVPIAAARRAASRLRTRRPWSQPVVARADANDQSATAASTSSQ